MLPNEELDLITPLPTGGYLVVPSRLLAKLYKYKQLNIEDKEAGGVLIGSWRSHILDGVQVGPVHIELTGCTQPSWMDRRSRFGFLRCSQHHIRQVLDTWRRSQQEQSYIGEWHTHPEPFPTPSWEDVSQWRRNLGGQKAILIIVGQQSDWVAYWDGRKAIPLPDLVADQLDVPERSP